MIRSLIWKDYRLNALILALGAALWIGPYLFGVVLLFYENGRGWAQAAAWANSLAFASTLSVTGSLLSALLLGANAIASERADRSADFLASLPPSRGTVLLSKVVVPLAAMMVLWGSNLLVALVIVPALGGSQGLGELVNTWWSTASMGMLLFGVGWLASSYLDSPSGAITLGLAAFMAVIITIIGFNSFLGAWLSGPDGRAGTPWISDAMAVVGALAFAWGSAYYLRRGEP